MRQTRILFETMAAPTLIVLLFSGSGAEARWAKEAVFLKKRHDGGLNRNLGTRICGSARNML